MASFLTDLFSSIFTPGPTPTLLVATNASFAGLQLVLGLLLFATRSVHFIILSSLCAGLWWAINWFARELHAANAKEEEAEREKRARGLQDSPIQSSEDTETEGETISVGRAPGRVDDSSYPRSGEIHKRRSLGEASAELSTEDEWEKVSAESMKER